MGETLIAASRQVGMLRVLCRSAVIRQPIAFEPHGDRLIG